MKTNVDLKILIDTGEFVGIAKGLSHDDHIAARAYISNSSMGALIKSPAHFQAYLRRNVVATPAMKLGTATHSAIVERALDRLAVEPKADGRTKEGKEIKAKFAADNAGKMILDQEEYNAVVGMMKAVHMHPQASLCFAGGVAETSIFWRDPATGVRCKARPDYLKASTKELIDLKTTEDASLGGDFRSFGKTAFNMGYYRQAAFYSDGVEAVYGFKPTFKIVAVEKNDPFGVCVYELTEAALNYGREQYRKALSIYAECESKGEWPCYFDGVQLLDLPAFAW